ncbi:hypothetical protein ACFQ6H_21265 [Rhodococcus sp. NPDC056506]|uniref:DUF6197 family protein n=1 Tax=Rhodococcus sp. NPDC056506 TaxID=3345844 RepID=UPI003670847A
MSEVATVLNRAADLLEQDGWTQGKMRDSNGCRCALGAMDRALLDLHRGPANLRINDLYVETMLNLRREIGQNNIPIWNDTPGRTATEVIAALRNAAKDAA